MDLPRHEFGGGELLVRKDLIQILEIVLFQNFPQNIERKTNVQDPVRVGVDIVASKLDVAGICSTVLLLWGVPQMEKEVIWCK